LLHESTAGVGWRQETARGVASEFAMGHAGISITGNFY